MSVRYGAFVPVIQNELEKIINKTDLPFQVKVWLDRTNAPLEYEAESTYQKGDLFCIKQRSNIYIKFPIQNIFKIEEISGGRL